MISEFAQWLRFFAISALDIHNISLLMILFSEISYWWVIYLLLTKLISPIQDNLVIQRRVEYLSENIILKFPMAKFYEFMSVYVCHNVCRYSHRVFIFIVGIQFWNICFTPPSISLSLSVSLLLSPTNSPIYITLSYHPHLFLSFFPPFSFFPFKTIQPMRRVWERVIDWGVCGWEKEGDWKRERERRGSETDVLKLYTYNEYELSVWHTDKLNNKRAPKSKHSHLIR